MARRWRHWWLWLREVDVSTPTQAAEAPLTVASIDEQLTHWAAKLPKAESHKQRQQWLGVVDQWLDVRNRITLTTKLEQDYRG